MQAHRIIRTSTWLLLVQTLSKLRNKKLLILGMLLTTHGIPFTINSQNPHKQFQSFTVKDGLSQSWVKSVFQDEHGFIWLGTRDGLNRFDGRQFRVFRAENNNPNSLPHSSISHVSRKSAHELWVCTEQGVAAFDFHTEHFALLETTRGFNTVQILPDTDGSLWVATENGLLLLKNDTVAHWFRNDENAPNSLSNNHIRSLYRDTKNNLWVATFDGLNLYNPDKKDFTVYYPGDASQSISGNDIWDLVEDDEGRMFVAVGSSATYDKPGLNQFLNFDQRPAPHEAAFKVIIRGSINKLLVDQQQRLWAGHGGSGGLSVIHLNSLNKSDLVHFNYKHSHHDTKSLTDNTIAALFLDNNKDVWIGTYGGGTNLYSPRIKPFHNYGLNTQAQHSFSSNLVNALLNDGRWLWIGTEGGLDRMDKESGKIKNYLQNSAVENTNPAQQDGDGVYTIYKDSKENLWIGTWGEGLKRYNRSTDKFDTFLPLPGDSTQLQSPNIFAIEEDQQNNLWIGTIRGGLSKYDYSTGQFTSYLNKPEKTSSLYNNSVNHILATSSGKLYISVYTALEEYAYEQKSFKHYKHQNEDSSSISSGAIEMAYEDSRGHIWVATSTGLNVLNEKDGTFHHFTTKDGLPGNAIQSIQEDHRGNLWISTNRGLAQFFDAVHLPKEPKFRVFTTEDGLPTNEFSLRASDQDEEGFLYFGSTSGFTRFHPDSIKTNLIPPPVVFTNFHVFSSSERMPPFNLPGRDINALEQINLKHDQNNFLVQFAALNFINNSKNRFKYMLEGYDQDWRNNGSINIANYTNINSGTYTFKVLASNDDGIWSSEPVRLKIFISTPWYQTLLFRVAVILLIALMVMGFFMYRIAIIRRQRARLSTLVNQRTQDLSKANQLLINKQEKISQQNKELFEHRNHLEQLIRERTHELQKAKERAETSDHLKTSFLANMSHEIRTPMNAIVGFANLLSIKEISEEERDRYIEIVNDNAESLLVLINDILDISRIEANEISLNLKEFDLYEPFSELEQFFQLNSSEEVTVKWTNPGHLLIVNDPVRFKQILSNLLSNAVKYTQEGHIHFGYTQDAEQLNFFVKDTGIGIAAEEIDKIFDHFYKAEPDSSRFYSGTGIGLAICRKLIRLMGGSIKVSSIQNQETTFFFTLPRVVKQVGTDTSVKKD